MNGTHNPDRAVNGVHRSNGTNGTNGTRANGVNGTMTHEDYDVVIIGAGISGINSAYRLREAFPDLKFAVLERRNVIGGTWSFWKYPGIRSDSSLSVFGFSWHPWPHEVDFAPAHLITEYIEDAAKTQGLDKHIRFGYDVQSSSWSSDEQKWTLEAEVHHQRQGGDDDDDDVRHVTIKTGWVFMCSGYYDYSRAREVDIPGLERFQGEVVHPQFWPEETDCTGKRVVIVGSGATAITIMPDIVDKAAQVTMLQRSPSYVLALPKRDRIRNLLRRILGIRLASKIDFWRRCLLEVIFAQGFLLNFPEAGRRYLNMEAKKNLPSDYPVDVHFNPRYNPFEQRLCMSPDGDFWQALKRPNCQVVTATIDSCDEGGLVLKQGPKGVHTPERLDADMIITATGLYVQMLDGKSPVVDGKVKPTNESYIWRSCMLDGVPNACSIQGYVAGSWTPGADVRIKTVLAVMKHQRRVGATSATPYMTPEERRSMPKRPVIPNSSTYLKEARSRLPLVGDRDPWRYGSNVAADMWQYYTGSVTKGMKYAMSGNKEHED
ncbi:monooxygenase [Pyricularia oryzae 70-15]|uniref:Monooxygenase n=1 Tax=Pyricularia oryzae (strain 70-15 / ATCC MYA-4617 / FGSC 8958) TaxID=242507 RepID=G4MXE9_PYRO7|nr:monooxygenase [Pyricularia oryzae 70-15]EHA53479.1 monooxygenase [Pyricularia oryzae 70-15]KAI7914762.1 monooxygenase [Pyricularia oryzae]